MTRRLNPTQPPSPAAPRKKGQAVPKGEGHDERDLILTRRDAAAGSPADCSVAGEEDPGVGLEAMVRRDQKGT